VNFKDRSIVATVAVGAAARRPTPSSAWITHLIALSALVGLLGVLNAQAIKKVGDTHHTCTAAAGRS
jgi:hypothetical protein